VGLRRGRRGKWRILGVGGGGGYCHFALLVAVVVDILYATTIDNMRFVFCSMEGFFFWVQAESESESLDFGTPKLPTLLFWV
jgi:hypothetical protein